jgi:hypothetical protein
MKDLRGRRPRLGGPPMKISDPASPIRGTQWLVKRTILLIVGILVSGVATALIFGKPNTLRTALVVLAFLCIAVWAVSFAILSVILLIRVLQSEKRRDPR